MRVGDADRRGQQPLLGDPRPAGHLAVAVERVDAGEHRIGPDLRPRGQIAVTPVRTIDGVSRISVV